MLVYIDLCRANLLAAKSINQNLALFFQDLLYVFDRDVCVKLVCADVFQCGLSLRACFVSV